MPTRLIRPVGIIAVLAALLTLGMLISGNTEYVGVAVVTAFAAVAVAFSASPALRSFAFTTWVLACVATGIAYPSAFQYWGEMDMRQIITPLNQIIMFDMGTSLALSDFIRVAKFPLPVAVGVILQFTIMPISGYVIATQGNFEPDVAAGIILIGVFSGGLASNLMTYLAKGNVALSVTMTAASTFMAPFVTPYLMSVFAGQMIPVDRFGMMMSILNMIIVPVVAGLFAHSIIYSEKRWARTYGGLGGIAGGCFAAAVFIGVAVSADLLGPFGGIKSGVVLGLCLLAVVALSKIVVRLYLNGPGDWMDRTLPVVAMAAICGVLTIIAAHGRDDLMVVGVALIFAAILHNAAGYALGYWGSKLAGYLLGLVGFRFGYYQTVENRMDERSCRTVAFEVGMQNAGAAVGVAVDVLGSTRAALASGVFGIWMNISGSMLANWWSRNPAQVAPSEIERQTAAGPSFVPIN